MTEPTRSPSSQHQTVVAGLLGRRDSTTRANVAPGDERGEHALIAELIDDPGITPVEAARAT